MVTRNDVKNTLLDIGVSEELLAMPSVLERVYKIINENNDESLEKVVLDGKIKIEENGDFSFGGYSFKRDKDTKGAVIQFEEIKGCKTTINVDKYGMDMRYYRESDTVALLMETPDDEKIIRIPEMNAIKIEGHPLEGRNFSASLDFYENKEVNDLGNYDILDNPDVLLYEYKRIREENKRFLTENYPITKGWFQERENYEQGIEEEIKETAKEEYHNSDDNKEHKTDIEKSRQIITEAIKRIEQLEAENKRMQEENSNNQKMLKTTLEFCDRVRSSVVGHVFFRKEIGNLPQAQQENDEGT